MNDDQRKAKLWRSYTITMGVMLGGTVIVLAGQYTWGFILQQFAKSSSTPVPTQPSSSSISPIPQSPVSTNNQTNPNVLTKPEAVNLLNRYLIAKEKIFGSEFDRQLAASLTTGEVYSDIVKPGGRIDSLKADRAYWKYGERRVKPLEYFSVNGNQAQIDVTITEELFYYENNIFQKSQKVVKDYRFIFQLENGTWKIADRKILPVGELVN